jgi:hypothetical protein
MGEGLVVKKGKGRNEVSVSVEKWQIALLRVQTKERCQTNNRNERRETIATGKKEKDLKESYGGGEILVIRDRSFRR